MKAKTLSKDLAGHMNKGVGMNMKTSIRKRGLIEILRGIIPRSMRTEREPEVQAREGRDPTEMTETMIEETTVKIGGETPI